jgi:hypothetical protein
MRGRKRHDVVLAVYPSARGLGFALFEGPLAPVDWGVHELRGAEKNVRSLRIVDRLIRRYQPDMLIVQDTSPSGTRRARRIRLFHEMLAELADRHGVHLRSYTRAQVRHCFAPLGLTTKDGIAETISRHLPELGRFLPPRRKPWMSEDARMSLFDAAALGLIFFQSELTDKATHEGVSPPPYAPPLG